MYNPNLAALSLTRVNYKLTDHKFLGFMEEIHTNRLTRSRMGKT